MKSVRSRVRAGLGGITTRFKRRDVDLDHPFVHRVDIACDRIKRDARPITCVVDRFLVGIDDGGGGAHEHGLAAERLPALDAHGVNHRAAQFEHLERA